MIEQLIFCIVILTPVIIFVYYINRETRKSNEEMVKQIADLFNRAAGIIEQNTKVIARNQEVVMGIVKILNRNEDSIVGMGQKEIKNGTHKHTAKSN